MAGFTTSDLELVETAIRTAVTEGVASVSIKGQAVQTYTLTELYDLRARIKNELAGDNPSARFGMRFLKTIPPGAG